MHLNSLTVVLLTIIGFSGVTALHTDQVSHLIGYELGAKKESEIDTYTSVPLFVVHMKLDRRNVVCKKLATH
jgi:hypothetical protein